MRYIFCKPHTRMPITWLFIEFQNVSVKKKIREIKLKIHSWDWLHITEKNPICGEISGLNKILMRDSIRAKDFSFSLYNIVILFVRIT